VTRDDGFRLDNHERHPRAVPRVREPGPDLQWVAAMITADTPGLELERLQDAIFGFDRSVSTRPADS
jgi:hypothetical protein